MHLKAEKTYKRFIKPVCFFAKIQVVMLLLFSFRDKVFNKFCASTSAFQIEKSRKVKHNCPAKVYKQILHCIEQTDVEIAVNSEALTVYSRVAYFLNRNQFVFTARQKK